jgi:inhibitor of the pro-sigma K processing machinery
MSSGVVIGIMVALIVILLWIGAPVKPMRFIGQATVKVGIGILFLFFFNVFAGSIGLHIPINVFTVLVSAFLGLFGIASLTAIQLFII